jgi:hypothetical protein
MPRKKSPRRPFQGLDFVIGFLRKAADVEIKKKDKCNTRLVIEIADRLSLIDRNYDVLAIRGRKVPGENAGTDVVGKVGDGIEASKDQDMSEAVAQVLGKIRGEKNDNAPAEATVAEDSVTSD